MAELLLKGLDVGNWRNGDVVAAFNNRRIRCVHAQHVCDYRRFGFTRDGLRPESLASKFQALTYRYRFDRDGDGVIRTEIRTGNRQRFGVKPNERGECIDIELYLRRRLAHHAHRIFGEPGREYWFGGHTDYSLATINRVWGMIEAESLHRERDYTRWPHGRLEVPPNFHHAMTDDFDDDVAAELVRRGEGKRARRYGFPGLPDFVRINIDRAA